MSNSSTHGDGAGRVSAGDLLEDLRTVVRDAEALLRATEGGVGERVDEIRARVEESLGNVKEHLNAEGLKDRARTAGKAADTYVRENPWAAVAIAVGLGYLLGRVGRRD